MTDVRLKKELIIRPVGYVKSDIKKSTFYPKYDVKPEVRKSQVRSHHRKIKNTFSELVVEPEYEELLDGIEAFSHIVVLFWPHLVPEDERRLKKVHPMGRKDIPKQGIFATRSPARPNPVLISSVRLIKRKKNILRVKGLDALDRSPIVDIKPVVRIDDGIERPVFPEWINQLRQDLR